MKELILNLWFLWIVIILVAIYRLFKPTIKGWFGEKVISLYLSKLPKNEYKLINDVTLRTDNGTTQIDHIVVSPYGVFIIETKNYKGWITGGEKSSQWTQNIYGKKKSFLNPILQNFGHVKAVKALLRQYPDITIIPIVAFSPECELKVKTTSHVVYYNRVCEVIFKYKKKVLRGKDIASIVSILSNKNMTSTDVKKEHVRSVRNKKANFDKVVSSGKCPRCNGNLIKRNGKNGPFLGCSNFPKCRFTKNI